MTHKEQCPLCGATIEVETDDPKHAEKRIKKFRDKHKCKGEK